MAKKLQIKRGPKANLPTLAQGEFAMTTDKNAEGLHIGNGSKNLQIPILDTTGKIPADQLPEITNIPITSEVPSDADIWIDPDADESVIEAITAETIRAICV